MKLDPEIAAEIDEAVEVAFGASDFWWRNFIWWIERGRPGMLAEDIEAERARYAHVPAAEQLLPGGAL